MTCHPRERSGLDAGIVFAVDHFGGTDPFELVVQPGKRKDTRFESTAGQFRPGDPHNGGRIVNPADFGLRSFGRKRAVNGSYVIGFAGVKQLVVG